jgi:glycerol transport system ATP-binding protein
MPDGHYTIGLRPHHLLPGGNGVEVSGEIQIAEISGSESTMRVNIEGNDWVSEALGIHSYQYGERRSFFFDAERCLYFDANDRLIETHS